MHVRNIISSYLSSPLSKIANPEHTSQYIVVNDRSSNRVIDLLMNKAKPVTLYNNLLTFRDADKKLKLHGDLFRMITNENYMVDLAKLSIIKKV